MKVEINKHPCYTCVNYFELRVSCMMGSNLKVPYQCNGCNYRQGNAETATNRIPDFDLLLWTYQTE